MFTTLMPQNFNKMRHLASFFYNLSWNLSTIMWSSSIELELFRPNQNLNGWDSSCEAFQFNLNYSVQIKIWMNETHHLKLFKLNLNYSVQIEVWMNEIHHVKLFKLNLNYSVQIKIWMDEILSRQYLYSSPSITCTYLETSFFWEHEQKFGIFFLGSKFD